MKTYIFPYVLDDGSVNLWMVNAETDSVAVTAFHREIGLSTEPEIRYAVMPAGAYPVTRTLTQQKEVS